MFAEKGLQVPRVVGGIGTGVVFGIDLQQDPVKSLNALYVRLALGERVSLAV